MTQINFYALTPEKLKMLDFDTFSAIFRLMLINRHKLFDDEYLNGEKPYIERVYEIITNHSPYFWVFYDTNTLKTVGFCYFYDIVTSKKRIHSACTSICFDKSVFGPGAQNAAKSLLSHVFSCLHITKIKAECYTDNYLIPKFLERLGFCREAILKNETVVRGEGKDIEVWSIFRKV